MTAKRGTFVAPFDELVDPNTPAELTFKGERVVREQAFRTKEEALEAAGLEDGHYHSR